MRLHHFAVLCVVLPLFGCAVDHAPRPVAQVQPDLRSASGVLTGTYEVVDSRFNDHNFTGVVVHQASDSSELNVTLTSPTFGPAVLSGRQCRGWVQKERGYASVMCESPANGINYYTLGKSTDLDHTIQDRGGVKPMFAPMSVPSGDYLLEYADSESDRSHYYVLARKPAQ